MIRDFIYLDLPRLQSFASQLLEGLPESATTMSGQTRDVSGEIRGGIPGLLGASASTKGVLSASATTTSIVHHRLVGLVLEKLEEGGFLIPLDALNEAPDGSFFQLTGELQVVDPDALGAMIEDFPALEKSIQLAGQNEPSNTTVRSRADKRAGRHLGSEPTIPRTQADAIGLVIKKLAANTVRVRILIDGRSVAVGVVERDKFVEDLGRLTARHGYRMGGTWEILGQVNRRSTAKPFIPDKAESLLDLVEQFGIDAGGAFMEASGVVSLETGITPLSIGRLIDAGSTRGAAR